MNQKEFHEFTLDLVDRRRVLNDAALNDDGNTPYSQAAGNPYRSTDIRDVYGTLLQRWLGIADASTILPADGGDPNAYWTVPNFNLGFQIGRAHV